MPGLIVTLDGSSTGYEAMLARSVGQAKAAGKEISLSLSQQIAVLEVAKTKAVPGSRGDLAIDRRLAAARTELAKDTEIQILAIKRAAGVQLSAAEAMRLREAGLEYRALGIVAAETEAWKIAANKQAMAKVISQEHEAAMMLQVAQDEEVAAVEAAEAAKIAANQAAITQIMAQEKAAGVVYENEKAAELAAFDILEGEKAAAAAAAEAEKVLANQAAIAQIIAQERAAGAVYENEKAAEVAAADILEGEKAAAALKANELIKLSDQEKTAAMIRDTQGALEWAQVADEARTAQVAKEAAEQVAITRAANIAMVASVAQAGSVMSGFGHGGGAGGGISGMMRETLVIFREIGRGNLTRVPGSLLLLLQYTGLLNAMMKNQKTEAMLAAAAEDKLAVSMSRTAMAAQAKLRAAQLAAGMDLRGVELKAAEAAVATADATAQSMRAEATMLAAAGSAKSADAAAANILAMEAEADLAIKDAQAQVLRARESAAAAAVVKASAGTTAAAVLMMMLPVLLLVAAIVAWYVAYKELSEALHRHNNEMKIAEETARAYNLSIVDTIELQNRLTEATKKTTDAIRKMNEEKDHAVENAQGVADAIRSEAEAASALYDAEVKGKLLDVDIAEKSHKISAEEATKERAAIREQAVKDKAAAKQDELDAQESAADAAAGEAEAQAKAAQDAFQAAEDKINKDPRGVDRKTKMVEMEKAEKELQRQLEAAQKANSDALTGGLFGGVDKKERAKTQEEIDHIEAALKTVALNKGKLKAAMSPDELAAAEAERIANEKTDAAKTLGTTANKAGIAAATNAANAPAQTAAEIANLEKQKKLDLIKEEEKKPEKKSGSAFQTTERERIGLGASSSVQVSMLDFTKKIAQNTAESKAILQYMHTHLKEGAGGFE